MANLSNIITPTNVLTASSTNTVTNKTISGASNTITNVPLSTGVTGTLPIANGGTNATATPTAGAVPYGTGTAYAFTAAGTSGQYLQSNGAGAPTWVTPSAGALVLLATITPTAAANVDFLNTFSSTYDNYLIIGNGITPSSYTSSPQLITRCATGGVVDTGTNYAGWMNLATPVASTSSFNSFGQMNQGGYNGFAMSLFNVNDTTQGKAIYVTYLYQPNGGASDSIGYTKYGMYLLTGAGSAVSGLRFFWSTGTNFSAVGKIRIYAYINA